MKKGDKLLCVNNIHNLIGNILFEENQIYTILGIDDDMIYIDHILYANEYNCFKKEWVLENFKTI